MGGPTPPRCIEAAAAACQPAGRSGMLPLPRDYNCARLFSRSRRTTQQSCPALADLPHAPIPS